MGTPGSVNCELNPWEWGLRSGGARRGGERGLASGAAQDRNGQGSSAAGQPGQQWPEGFVTGEFVGAGCHVDKSEGFVTDEFLGAGHHVDSVARRMRGLTSDYGSPWYGRQHQHVPRPGVDVVSVGSFPANGLGNILGGPGRGRGAGPWQRSWSPRPGVGALEQGLETWEGDWTGLTATQQCR